MTYTPKGSTQQTYSIVGDKILNKEGKEVFKKDSKDRRKILANFKVKQKEAVVINITSNQKESTYVVDRQGEILSATSGNVVFEDRNHGTGKEIRSKAEEKFNRMDAPTPNNTGDIPNIDFDDPNFDSFPDSFDPLPDNFDDIGDIADGTVDGETGPDSDFTLSADILPEIDCK